MDMLRERDSEPDSEIQCADVDHTFAEGDCDEPIEPLDTDVLVRCGRLLSDYFRRYANGDVSDDEDDYGSEDSYCSEDDYGETYMDIALRQTFDWLYDTMLQDMEKADFGYPAHSKLKFYYDLSDFVRYHKLHEINRYVFGDGPCGDWDPDTVAALEVVRAWRTRYQDDIERLPDSLIETYDVAAKNPDMQPSDVAMVAFAVFGFLLGYDTKEDFELLYAYRDIKAVHGPKTDFRRVRNCVTRNAREFIETYGSLADCEYFEEALVDDADVVALCKWMYDTAAERPDFVDRLADNPFDVDGQCRDAADGTRLPASTVVQLRVFHRWASRETLAVLSGVSQRRISLLDNHVNRCMCSCMSTVSWLKMFNDFYAHMLLHLTDVLVEYGCPDAMLKTLQSTWHQEAFKRLVKRCLKTLLDRNSNLRYRDSSTDSNDSVEYSNGSSADTIE